MRDDLTSNYAQERSHPAAFDGETFDPVADGARLTGQLKAVFDVMKCGLWQTLEDISASMDVPASVTSISARLRDFRKPRFGGHTVNRRTFIPGIYQYQLVLNTERA